MYALLSDHLLMVSDYPQYVCLVLIWIASKMQNVHLPTTKISLVLEHSKNCYLKRKSQMATNNWRSFIVVRKEIQTEQSKFFDEFVIYWELLKNDYFLYLKYRRPGSAGRCRVCVKAMKPDEFSKECTECLLQVCDDCASYSHNADGNEVRFYTYRSSHLLLVIRWEWKSPMAIISFERPS